FSDHLCMISGDKLAMSTMRWRLLGRGISKPRMSGGASSVAGLPLVVRVVVGDNLFLPHDGVGGPSTAGGGARYHAHAHRACSFRRGRATRPHPAPNPTGTIAARSGDRRPRRTKPSLTRQR